MPVHKNKKSVYVTPEIPWATLSQTTENIRHNRRKGGQQSTKRPQFAPRRPAEQQGTRGKGFLCTVCKWNVARGLLQWVYKWENMFGWERDCMEKEWGSTLNAERRSRQVGGSKMPGFQKGNWTVWRGPPAKEIEPFTETWNEESLKAGFSCRKLHKPVLALADFTVENKAARHQIQPLPSTSDDHCHGLFCVSCPKVGDAHLKLIWNPVCWLLMLHGKISHKKSSPNNRKWWRAWRLAMKIIYIYIYLCI